MQFFKILLVVTVVTGCKSRSHKTNAVKNEFRATADEVRIDPYAAFAAIEAAETDLTLYFAFEAVNHSALESNRFGLIEHGKSFEGAETYELMVDAAMAQLKQLDHSGIDALKVGIDQLMQESLELSQVDEGEARKKIEEAEALIAKLQQKLAQEKEKALAEASSISQNSSAVGNHVVCESNATMEIKANPYDASDKNLDFQELPGNLTLEAGKLTATAIDYETEGLDKLTAIAKRRLQDVKDSMPDIKGKQVHNRKLVRVAGKYYVETGSLWWKSREAREKAVLFSYNQVESIVYSPIVCRNVTGKRTTMLNKSGLRSGDFPRCIFSDDTRVNIEAALNKGAPFAPSRVPHALWCYVVSPPPQSGDSCDLLYKETPRVFEHRYGPKDFDTTPTLARQSACQAAEQRNASALGTESRRCVCSSERLSVEEVTQASIFEYAPGLATN